MRGTLFCDVLHQTESLQRDTVRVFNNTEIEKFTYTYATSSYTLEKQDGKWIYPEDPSMKMDDVLIAGMLSVAANIPISDTIEGVTDFEQYGLAEPYLTVTCSDGENEYTVLMGDFNTTIRKYFIRINGENKVYTADSSLYNTFTRTVESLQAKEE